MGIQFEMLKVVYFKAYKNDPLSMFSYLDFIPN